MKIILLPDLNIHLKRINVTNYYIEFKLNIFYENQQKNIQVIEKFF